MADVLRLANVDQSTTVDLLSGTLKLRDGSFSPRSPGVQNEYKHARFGVQTTFKYYDVVVEQFDLVAKDTTANVLAGIGAIESLLEKCRLFHEDPLQVFSVWLEQYANSENARRTLLFEGSIQYPSDLAGISVFNPSGILARLSLSRHPLWENIAQVSNNYNGISCWGGVSTAISNTGTAPARIWFMQLKGASGGGGPVTRFWAGIRPTYQGVANFTPVWEMEAGSVDSSSALASEAGASPSGSSTNNKIRTNFGAGGASLLRRAYVQAFQIAGIGTNYFHMLGRYLVLLRCKLSAAGQVGVQLRSGIRQSGVQAFPANSEVYITHTAWQLVELGEVLIPPTGYRQSVQNNNALKYFTMEVWAERLSGSCDLDIDALCLIPSEHFAYVDGAGVQYVLGDEQPVYFITDETDEGVCLSYLAGTPNNILEFVMRDFYLPVEGGVLVVAGQESGSHVLSDQINVNLQTFPRWLSLRNA